MADSKGYYAGEGLDVTLKELGEKTPIEQVVAGEADFGLTSADTLLRGRADGAPVVAIATLYQRSPVAFISLAEKNITTPQDLIGKNVVVHFEGVTGIVYEAMLKTQGIELSQINNMPRTDFSNEPLLSGQADVLDAFITNQPVQLAQEGHEINAILPSDYGVDIYANVIFTTEDMIANKPDLVEHFLRATIQGIQAALDDPEGAAASTVTYNANLNLESETESMLRSLPLLNPGGSRPGMMTAENWEITHQILADQGLLSKPLDVSQAYTLAFLEKIHNSQ
jgi:ABC-type nitrate/sulfonate/bicarbonate transport system substrate-binding protein